VRRTKRLPQEELQPYLLELPKVEAGTPAWLDWQSVFGNDHPVEIEVGFGKGLFLLNAATSRPEVNFAGIEIERKYQLFTATRLALRKLTNVRVACADARLALRHHVVSESVQAVHVYFPDPWWKKRHHKRRVFTDEFARECVRVLRPRGQLHLATDVEDYYQMVLETVASLPLRALSPPPEHEPQHDLDYLTNFERKARQQGKLIHRAVFERVESAEVTSPDGPTT
jgi:tRNA (guanine-N7-)-methyltransferase